MQSAGNLVRMIVELAAGMQFGHNDLDGRYFFFFVNPHRNAPSVIDHTDAVVIMNGDVDLAAITCHGLVDAVVHNLVDQMMQAGDIHVSNVHSRPFADRFQAFQYFNVVFGVIVCF